MDNIVYKSQTVLKNNGAAAAHSSSRKIMLHVLSTHTKDKKNKRKILEVIDMCITLITVMVSCLHKNVQTYQIVHINVCSVLHTNKTIFKGHHHNN